MSKKRVLIGVGLLIAAGSAVGLGLSRRSRGERPVAVECEPVARREIRQTVSATGRIQPKTEVKISADVSAKITRLYVEEGQWVEQGAPLVELERERYLAGLESAEASLRVAEASARVPEQGLIKAEQDLTRVRDLHRAGLETQAALDAALAAYESEKARARAANDQVEQTRASVKQTRDELSKTRIFAPMSGTVSRLNKEVGEIALGSQFQADVILVLSNLNGMEALLDVGENDIVSVTLGDVATIEVDALPGVEFKGRVTEIANSAKINGQGTTDQNTAFEIKVAIDEPGLKLRPGMTATAEVLTEEHADVLGVPIQSVAVRTLEQLGGDAGKWKPDKSGLVELVFLVEGGTALARQVRTGIQSDTHIEILEGLTEGANVVVGSYRAISRDLQDGSAITVQAPGAPATRAS